MNILNIRCITYKDNFSAKNSAYKDLMLGYEYGVVGCSSKVFGSLKTKKGDIVIINAKKDGVTHAIIGCLDTKLVECKVWSNEGGYNWDYNWTYVPLTDKFQYDTETKDEIIELCTTYSLKYRNLFNSRLCSNKLLSAVELLIKKFSSHK